jgi:hypothetical protein
MAIVHQRCSGAFELAHVGLFCGAAGGAGRVNPGAAGAGMGWAVMSGADGVYVRKQKTSRIGFQINLFYAAHQLFRLAGAWVSRYSFRLKPSPRSFPVRHINLLTFITRLEEIHVH